MLVCSSYSSDPRNRNEIKRKRWKMQVLLVFSYLVSLLGSSKGRWSLLRNRYSHTLKRKLNYHQDCSNLQSFIEVIKKTTGYSLTIGVNDGQNFEFWSQLWNPQPMATVLPFSIVLLNCSSYPLHILGISMDDY